MLQFATSNRGGRRKQPLAFTEHGAIMAATVLNSPRAVEMSVYVVRAFVKLREVLASNAELAGKLAALEKSVATLDAKTREFRALYEDNAENGARGVYDAGITYLSNYYHSAADFDPTTITSLLRNDSMVVRALRASPVCALVFYVFDLDDRSEEGRFRCLQLDCRAELYEDGPLFDNVWWHNSVFHGKQ